ncbi:MAG: transporter substrate-binding domain-containing protein [Chlamydiota bacterium]
MNRLILSIIALVFCLPLLAKVDNTDIKYVIGTNAEYPPYCFVDRGEVVGLDIDIAAEVCHRLGKEMKIKDIPSFDAIIPEVIFDKVHFLAAGMTPTPERSKRVLFTRPYLTQDALVVIVPEASDNSLEGKRVVVSEGYTADLYISSQDIEGMKLIRLANPAEGFLALKSNQADAFLAAESTWRDFESIQRASGFKAHKIPDTDQCYALAVSKKHPELLMQIQDVLDSMESDGTIKTLKEKWGF